MNEWIFSLQITVFGLADLINEWINRRPLIGWLDEWITNLWLADLMNAFNWLTWWMNELIGDL